MSIDHHPEINSSAKESEQRTLDPSSVETPTVEDLHDQYDPNRKKSILEKLDTRAKKVGAGVLLFATVIGGGALGAKIAEGIGQQHGSAEPHPTASAEPFPSTTADPLETTNSSPEVTDGTEKPFTVETMEIKAGLTPEEFGKTLIDDRYNRWLMAGAVPENKTKWLDQANGESFVQSITAENAKIATESLLVPGWESDKNLSDYAKFEQGANNANLTGWLITYKSMGGGDQEAYKEWLTTKSVELISSDATGRIIRITGNQFNNAAKNKVGDINPSSLELNGKSFVSTFTTKIIDGKEYIANVVRGK